MSPELFTDPRTGEVVGSVVVDADLDHVRAWLADPRRLLAETEAEATVWPAGECDELVLTTEHPLSALVYSVRWCPTSDGARATLLEGDLAAYDASFVATAVPGGVEVRYGLTLVPVFRAPAMTNRAAARRQVETALRAVARVFEDAVRVDDLR